jgi:3-methyladenine DNA glycosylase/8-oxoguanine DNA glycosylase
MLCESMDLEAIKPFSLKSVVLSHGWHECAPMSWSEGGQCFQIIERVHDRPIRVSVVEGRRNRHAVRLQLKVEADEIDDALLRRVGDQLRVVLALDEDLSEFHALCATHPTLFALKDIGAGRALRSHSMTENILKALCATNVNWAQAVKMINRLGQLGPGLRDYRNLNAWPTPREILRAGEKYLLEVCRVGYRAASILQFCEDVCEARIDPQAMDAAARDPGVDSDEILAQLRKIHGIGPSSAHYLLSMMGRHDRLSIDSATFAHVAGVHTNGRKPSIKKIERIYAPYGKWKNRVCWFENWIRWDSAKQIVEDKRRSD